MNLILRPLKDGIAFNWYWKALTRCSLRTRRKLPTLLIKCSKTLNGWAKCWWRTIWSILSNCIQRSKIIRWFFLMVHWHTECLTLLIWPRIKWFSACTMTHLKYSEMAKQLRTLFADSITSGHLNNPSTIQPKEEPVFYQQHNDYDR